MRSKGCGTYTRPPWRLISATVSCRVSPRGIFSSMNSPITSPWPAVLTSSPTITLTPASAACARASRAPEISLWSVIAIAPRPCVWALASSTSTRMAQGRVGGAGREGLVHVHEVELHRRQRFLDRPRDIDRQRRGASPRAAGHVEHLADSYHAGRAAVAAREQAVPARTRGAQRAARFAHPLLGA